MSPSFVSFPPFRYMRWAKTHHGSGRFNLAKSGLGPPPPELLPLSRLSTDLEQRGHDMPPPERARLAAMYGVPEERLMLTLGTSQAMFLAARARLAPGHQALVETPSYELLPNLPPLLGAEMVPFERRMDQGYRLPADLPARVRALRPSAVILSNPHNPTGAMLSLDELRPVSEAAAEVGALLLVDEVYLEFFDDAAARSALSLGEHVAVASSITKAFGLGTVRFGWLVSGAPLIDQALSFDDYLGVVYPNPSAWVGAVALDHAAALRARAQQTRRDGLAVLARWMEGRDDVRWHPSEAGVMALLELPGVADVEAWCRRLLEEQQTLVVPGHFFGAPQCIRVGFAAEADMVASGLEALARQL